MKQKINTLLYGCLILLSSITAQQLQAQTCVELVTNGSFETVTTTPPYNSQPGYPSFMPYATGWNQHVVPNYNGTPDLFTTSSPTNPIVNNSVHIPCSFYGYQNARTGNSYAGLLTVHNDNSFSGANCSEFITTNFTSTLTAGKIYEVSLWVSRADLAGFAINGLGVWIGTAGINAQADIPTYNCPTSLLNNDAWTQITFPYCANGDETLIIIGGSSTTYGSTLTLPSYTCTQNSNYNNPTQGAGSYIFIDDVSVKEVAFTVPTQTLCAEYSGTFTAVPTCSTITTSALTYTWNYGDGTTVVSTNTLNVTTHSYAATPTGQYNATLTVGNGTCTNTYTYNVVIPNVPITITTNTNTICNGTVNFTATPSPLGSYTYTWSLKDAATGTVIPTSNYTITAGTTATPAINFANINQNVNVCVSITSTLGCNYTQCLYMPSCCSTPAGATKYSNRTFTTTTTIFNTGSGAAFGGTITVNTGVTLQIINTKVQMDPNTKFVINGTGKLTIVNSYLYGCNAMWDGIYPLGTNTVIIRESRIEDAQRVLIDSVGGAVITFTNNYVNKNYQGLVFKAVKTNTSSVNVNGNLFTCSSMPTPTVQPWGVPAALKPNLTNAPTFGGYSSVNLMAPYNTLKSFCGIYSAGAAHTGKANSAITIGAATNGNENVFDKMQYGAYSYVSKMEFQNNVFQNIKNSIAPSIGGINSGIVVLGPFFGGGASRMDIGGSIAKKNTFSNNDYGVYNGGASIITTSYNKFDGQDQGVYIAGNNNNSSVAVSNNKFLNNRVGINFNSNTLIVATISENWMDNTSAQGTPVNNFAIRCTETVIAANTSGFPDFTVYNNYINGYYNGICHIKTLESEIKDNEVHMRQSSGDVQFGIQSIASNSNDIFNNLVDAPSLNTWAWWQAGIFTDQSVTPKIHCNSVTNVYNAIAANSLNNTTPGNGIVGNAMQNAVNGFNLDANGEIGDQYYTNLGTNYSADNTWTNCNFETCVAAGSNTLAAVFFTRPTGIYSINTPTNIGGGAFLSGTNSSTGFRNACYNSVITPTLNLKTTESPLMLMQNAEDIALNTINYGAYNQSMRYIAQKQLFSKLSTQATLINAKGNNTMSTFMNNCKQNNIGVFYVIDSLINIGDSSSLNQALQLNTALMADNLVDATQQQVNQVYIPYTINRQQAAQLRFDLTNSDIITLENIATLCPNEYGDAVHQARSILFNTTKLQYSNVCERFSDGSTERKAFVNPIVKGTNIKLYPNPSNGSITFETNNDLNYQVCVYNLLGVKVFESSASNNQTINLAHLTSATYIVHIQQNGSLIKTERISIVH